MSLKVEKKNEETLALTGRLDAVTAPELEQEIMPMLSSIHGLLLDMTGVEYVSSAGLRVILKIYRALVHKNGLVLTGVQESVKEVFDITGFSDFLVMK